ncbi:hypothetical protein VTJ83DRAFT_3880 [Remersonia thermophila]|uniref:Uncharacterized protein n=1 Tax=Remersonia thermophila TaxID=72144 RepID=A0ABR4DFF7_9PEZI
MSKIFRSRRYSAPKRPFDPSGYSSLLGPTTLAAEEQEYHEPGDDDQAETRQLSSPETAAAFVVDPYHARPWWNAAERHPSWTGPDRPPPRKLVKDKDSSMNGAGRPSFSFELSDGSDTEGGKAGGIVRRQIARLKELYRKEK